MAAILVLHGPNLNLLGTREPEIYGSETLDEINHRLRIEAERVGATLTCLQSNGEQELVEAIHQARTDGTQFVIINPAAFTHTSVAIRDALSAVQIPCIEVHISNIYAREPFRHHSYISDVAEAVISGLGSFGYDCALAAVLQSLDTHSTQH
ncbi:MAG: type II 3-dehydroquinate dehydratase [Pseudomonadota bacterium]|nr:type II 3-dehydroquinate dehydratase [Pseudomonadota bacterium]